MVRKRIGSLLLVLARHCSPCDHSLLFALLQHGLSVALLQHSLSVALLLGWIRCIPIQLLAGRCGNIWAPTMTSS